MNEGLSKVACLRTVTEVITSSRSVNKPVNGNNEGMNLTISDKDRVISQIKKSNRVMSY